MKIEEFKNEDSVILELEGRLDTNNSRELEEKIENLFEDEKYNIVLDFKNVSYVSSSGLRVLLGAQKKISAGGSEGKMVIKNPNEDTLEIFEITGFSNILNIEIKRKG